MQVWSDGGLGEARDAFSIPFERQRFEAELDRAGKELCTFLTLSAAWAQSAGFSNVDGVCRKLDRCFCDFGTARRHVTKKAGECYPILDA